MIRSTTTSAYRAAYGPVLVGDEIAGSAFDELAEHRVVDPLDRIRLELVGDARAGGLVDRAGINGPAPTPPERARFISTAVPLSSIARSIASPGNGMNPA